MENLYETDNNQGQKDLRKIVLTDKWPSRSRALNGVGHTVCRNIDTGEISHVYDPEMIMFAEKSIQRQIDQDPMIDVLGFVFKFATFYEVAKKRIKQYFSKEQ